MMLRFLSALVSASMVVSPLASRHSHAQNLASPKILMAQSNRIQRYVVPTVSLYQNAKRAYESKGPQAFVDLVSKPANLGAADERALVKMFQGLPSLPDIKVGHRGFAMSNRQNSFVYNIEVADFDARILKINGVTFVYSDSESFEDGAARLQVLLNTLPTKISFLNKAWQYLLPEAKAFLIPLLVGGGLFAVMRIFFGMGKDTTASVQSKESQTFAPESFAAAGGAVPAAAHAQVVGGAPVTAGSSLPPAAGINQAELARRDTVFEALGAHRAAATFIRKSVCYNVNASTNSIQEMLNGFFGEDWAVTTKNNSSLAEQGYNISEYLKVNTGDVVTVALRNGKSNDIPSDQKISYTISMPNGKPVVQRYVGSTLIEGQVDCSTPDNIKVADTAPAITPSAPANHEERKPPKQPSQAEADRSVPEYLFKGMT